ncbi:MAG: prephenate dehydrogenase, partial [Clostridia bacterium]|nr:prephenate dehydrogenase [Clostridia bacterium]
FQDRTRIAGVDENVWAELYLLNGEKLSAQIGSLVSSLNEIKAALDGGEEEELKRVLKSGRETFEKNKG